MSLQPPSAFTSLRDCSGNKCHLCCICHVIYVTYVTASLSILLCIIFWHFYQQLWERIKKQHPESSQQQCNAKTLTLRCILNGTAQRSVHSRYYPIFSVMTHRMEQSALIRVTDSMNKMIYKYTTQQDHNSKGSRYPEENSWKGTLVRTNTGFSTAADKTNYANMSQRRILQMRTWRSQRSTRGPLVNELILL